MLDADVCHVESRYCKAASCGDISGNIAYPILDCNESVFQWATALRYVARSTALTVLALLVDATDGPNKQVAFASERLCQDFISARQPLLRVALLTTISIQYKYMAIVP